jgi:hypothetical protein
MLASAVEMLGLVLAWMSENFVLHSALRIDSHYSRSAEYGTGFVVSAY